MVSGRRAAKSGGGFRHAPTFKDRMLSQAECERPVTAHTNWGKPCGFGPRRRLARERYPESGMAIAYIGLGSNLASAAGSPEVTLAAARERLAGLGRVIRCSSLYSTAPVGFADQPRFLNAVVGLETGLAPRELLEELLAIEQEFGRDRSAAAQKNGPRALDLDILLFGDLVLNEHNLEVPHPRLGGRAFVLVPLGEIAPGLREPRSGFTVGELLERLATETSAADPEGKAHAVVQVESDPWRAGACGADGGSAGSARADDGHNSSFDPDHA